MVPIRKPKVALQHPSWGGVSVPTAGAEGNALLLAGLEPTSRRSARSHPASMTRLKSITLAHIRDFCTKFNEGCTLHRTPFSGDGGDLRGTRSRKVQLRFVLPSAGNLSFFAFSSSCVPFLAVSLPN